MYFPPKRDFWHGLLVISVNIFFVFGLWHSFWHLFFTPMIIFFLWLWFGTGYAVAEKELVIRYGPFHKNIPYSMINRVTNPRFYLSSAALAFDRLEIHGKFNNIAQISPLDEQKFIEVLKERCLQANIHIFPFFACINWK